MVRVSIKTPFESDSSTSDKIHVLKKNDYVTSALQGKKYQGSTLQKFPHES